MIPISYIVSLLFDVVVWIIIIDCLLSWIPNIDYYKQPFRFIHNFTAVLLEPARRIIPPIGGLDISPIVIVLLLTFCSNAIYMMLKSYGL